MSRKPWPSSSGSGRARLCPNRLNAINPELLEDLVAALTQANADPATRVIILTGAGRAFCAGDDLKEFDRQVDGEAETRAYGADPGRHGAGLPGPGDRGARRYLWQAGLNRPLIREQAFGESLHQISD